MLIGNLEVSLVKQTERKTFGPLQHFPLRIRKRVICSLLRLCGRFRVNVPAIFGTSFAPLRFLVNTDNLSASVWQAVLCRFGFRVIILILIYHFT